jgi:hypothetical protein
MLVMLASLLIPLGCATSEVTGEIPAIADAPTLKEIADLEVFDVSTDTLGVAPENVAETVATADELLDCKFLVKVPVTRYYGNYGEGLDVLNKYRVQRTHVVYGEAPGAAELEVLGLASIGGIGQAPVVSTEKVNLIVEQTWTLKELELMETRSTDFYLPLATAPLFLGTGSIEQICYDIDIVESIPSFGRSGYDRVHIHIGNYNHHHDWTTYHNHDVKVWEAREFELDTPMRYNQWIPQTILANTPIVLDQFMNIYDTPSESAPLEAGTETTEMQSETSGAETAALGMTALVGGAGSVALLALIGLAFLAIRRRN